MILKVESNHLLLKLVFLIQLILASEQLHGKLLYQIFLLFFVYSLQHGRLLFLYFLNLTRLLLFLEIHIFLRLIQAVLERHNLWDQEAFRKVKPEELAALFGADGVLYMKVLSYNVTTRIIYTNRRIGLSYKMFARDGKLMHEDMHYVQLPLDPDSSEYNPLASVINGVAAALEKDGPINAMQAVTSISFDFAPGPYHDDSFGWTVRVPFQDKVILNPHPRSKDETRLETDRDPDNI